MDNIFKEKNDKSSQLVGCMVVEKKKTLLQQMRGTPYPRKLPESLSSPNPVEYTVQ
jgi:hypothetical protein